MLVRAFDMRVARVAKRANCEIGNVSSITLTRDDTFSSGGALLSRRRNALSIALQPWLQIYVNLWLNFICRSLTLAK
jgi:hypothetical protein